MYYLNDGVYGSFNCILLDHYIPQPYALKGLGNELHTLKRTGDELYECSLWGPTCDSQDCISKSIYLPKVKFLRDHSFELVENFQLNLAEI